MRTLMIPRLRPLACPSRLPIMARPGPRQCLWSMAAFACLVKQQPGQEHQLAQVQQVEQEYLVELARPLGQMVYRGQAQKHQLKQAHLMKRKVKPIKHQRRRQHQLTSRNEPRMIVT